jgi:hypothetical protein
MKTYSLAFITAFVSFALGLAAGAACTVVVFHCLALYLGG